MSALIVAYGLATFSIITADEVAFLLLNITGAAGIIIVSVADKVRQTALLNAFWLLIGLVALIKIVVLAKY